MTPPLRRYRKRAGRPVVAVRLPMDSDGLNYRKWGGPQHAKPGDWLVDNQGDVYTVDAAVFDATYRGVGPGQYVKVTPVWAHVAQEAGSVVTKEGRSHHRAGDVIVANQPDGSDAWCMSAADFEAMYEPWD